MDVLLLTPNAIMAPINPHSAAEAPTDGAADQNVLSRNPPTLESR